MQHPSAVSFLDHPRVSELCFFPRRDAPATIERVPVEGAMLACALHRTSTERPLLVHFHGNGETVADYAPLASRFASLGIDTFFAEYRGYGASTGTPALTRMLADVERVLEHTGTPPENTFVYGRSIGSLYAIEAARRWPRLGGLVIESGVADILERALHRVRPEQLGLSLGLLRAEVRRYFDHEAKLRAYHGRVLVLHGQEDQTIPVAHAERNAGWARSSELTIFPRCDHRSILVHHGEAIVEKVRAFVTGS